MKVLITGGAGFLGERLARRLLTEGALAGPSGAREAIDQLTILDVAPPQGLLDPRLRVVLGSISDPAAIAAALANDVDSIFHLAAVVSGQAEANFSLGMHVNFDATRLLLDLARQVENRPRLVFTSSVAVFGAPLPPVVHDDTAAVPQSSYGAQKLMCELLVHEYSRRGFVDGRSLRMPTIAVRPGVPNAAASGFASGIIREPLAGQEAVCPVPPGTVMWLMSPATAVENLVRGHELPPERLGTSRTVNMPGLSVAVGEMVAALERVAGRPAARLVRWERDPAVERIVGSWPGRFETPRALDLGFCADASFEEVILAYVEEARAGAVPPPPAAQEGVTP
jgi:nucleoside-diphosphate-sugar epimerase